MPLSKEQGEATWLRRFDAWVAKAHAKHQGKYQYQHPKQVGGKLRILCPDHGEFLQRPAKHLYGQQCPSCAGVTRAAPIGQILAQRFPGFTFVDVPPNNKTAFVVECAIHGEFSTRVNRLLNKPEGVSACPQCARAMGGALRRKSVSKWMLQVQAAFNGTVTLDPMSVTVASAKVTAICAEHGAFTPVLQDLIAGHGCPQCGRLAANQKTTSSSADAIGALVSKRGHRYIYHPGSYAGSKAEVKITCPTHGSFWQIYANHRNGADCPACANQGASVAEGEIATFVESLGLQVRRGVRDVLHRMEIDILVPERNVAIEFNGLYWHGEKHRPKQYHVGKTEDCKVAGLRLIHVFEDEWTQNAEAVKTRLAHILGVASAKVGARSLKLETVAWSVAADFYDRYHLQGAGKPSSQSFALTQGGIVVACMSFAAARYGAKDAEIEMVRYSSAIPVVGGFSRLFAAFLKANPSVNSVVSYSDRRWSEGDVYAKCGFLHTGDSEPGYWWCKGGDRYSRQGFQKHMLASKLKVFDPELSEVENMKANGFWRVYDCGVGRWLFKRS